MGFIIDIEYANRTVGITLFSTFHVAVGLTDYGIAISAGIWKLLTYISLEWRKV